MRDRLPAAFGVAVVMLIGLGGCRSVGAFSERVADDARFWGDQSVAYILGDDPSKD